MLALSLLAFRKRFGLSQATVNGLVKEGRVQLQQNGYVGDILHHHKLIIFPDGFSPVPKLLRTTYPDEVPVEGPRIYKFYCRRCRATEWFVGERCHTCGWNRQRARWKGRAR